MNRSSVAACRPRTRRALARAAALTLGAALMAGPGLTSVASAEEPAPSTRQAQGPSVLEPGDHLKAGQRLRSPNGRHELMVQRDGNVVLSVTDSGRPRWATMTTGRKATALVLQADGNLVLRDAARRVRWSSDTAGHRDARLAVLDDGRLLLSWPDGRRALAGRDDQLAPGETLRPGQSLTSPQGKFTLELQDDGNLVEVQQGLGPVWASGTRGAERATITAKGALTVTVTKKKKARGSSWSSGATKRGVRLEVHDDGGLALYSGSKQVWSRADEERKRLAAAAAAAAPLTSPGNDYPDQAATPCGFGVYCVNGAQYSLRGFAYRNCTDFVAFKRGMVWSQIADGLNGHAMGWRQGWIERGRVVSATPKVGAVAWWGRGFYGHVAYVVDVNPDGSALVEQYNAGGGGEFSIETVRADAYLY